MEKSLVKNLFIAVIILLVVQYGIVGIVGFYHSEPWPAFVLPGFKNVYVYDDGFEIEQIMFEVWADGYEGSVIIQPQELFPQIPLSQIPGFTRTHFRDSVSIQKISDSGIGWLGQQVYAAVGSSPLEMDVVYIKEYYTHAEGGAAVRDSIAVLQRSGIKFRSQ